MDFRVGDIVRFTTDKCYHSTREWPVTDPMPEPQTPGVVIRVAPCTIVKDRDTQTVWVSYPTQASPNRNLCTFSDILELVFPFVTEDMVKAMQDRFVLQHGKPSTMKRKIRIFLLGHD